MARFGVNDADKYGGQGGGGYFGLKNDKETARVRFLINTIDDVEGFAVHEIELDGKKRYVNCLRDYGQPMDVCPFCANKMFTQVKYFIPLYNVTEDKMQTWERGKKFGAKISSLCARYPSLVSQEFEIERNGKPGDTQTTYEIYAIGNADNSTLEDFDEVPDALGTIILDKSADEMNYFLDYNDFPEEQGAGRREATPDEPVGRRGGRSEEPARRTPAGRR